MVKRVRTRIEGARELDQVLRKLPKQLGSKTLSGALFAAAKIVLDAFRESAPVWSGRMRQKVARLRLRKTSFSATVLVGWFRRVFYATFQEFGNEHQPARPFARPAWERVRQKALDEIGRQLGRKLEQAARKLAGSFAKSGLARRKRKRRRRR